MLCFKHFSRVLSKSETHSYARLKSLISQERLVNAGGGPRSSLTAICRLPSVRWRVIQSRQAISPKSVYMACVKGLFCGFAESPMSHRFGLEAQGRRVVVCEAEGESEPTPKLPPQAVALWRVPGTSWSHLGRSGAWQRAAGPSERLFKYWQPWGTISHITETERGHAKRGE